jgi:hypothetical protein
MLNEVDRMLVACYGFTNEDVDSSSTNDIKYRMRREVKRDNE